MHYSFQKIFFVYKTGTNMFLLCVEIKCSQVSQLLRSSLKIFPSYSINIPANSYPFAHRTARPYKLRISLSPVQLYQEVFEIEFLRETETMYHAEALRMMRDPGFMVGEHLFPSILLSIPCPDIKKWKLNELHEVGPSALY